MIVVGINKFQLLNATNNNKKASSSSSGMISTRRYLLVGCFCYECCVDVKKVATSFLSIKVVRIFSDDDDTFNFLEWTQ